MFKDWAEFVLLSLMYARDNGLNLNDIVQYYRKGDNPRHGNQTDRDRAYRIYKRLWGSGFANSVRLEHLIEDLGRQLDQAQANQNVDGAIIDEVVKMVSMTFGRNTIHGETLNHLRRTLLIPEELSELRTKLDRAELRCYGCGRRLQDGEMVTLNVQEGRNRDVAVTCVYCRPPDFVPCKCGELTATPKSITGNLNKGVTCPNCAGKTKPKPAQAEAPRPPAHPDDQVQIEFQRMVEAERQRMRARQPYTLRRGIFADPPAPEGGTGNGG